MKLTGQHNENVNRKSILNARLTTTMSISLVLFLLGLIVLSVITARGISAKVKENISFNIMLDENMNEADIKRLQKKLDLSPYVRSTEMITKEQALADLSKNLGDDPQHLLNFNPVRPSIEVHLNSEYANKESVENIEKQLKENETNVRDILYREDMVEIVNENVRNIGMVLGMLAFILLVISIALINNTIELSIYAKRFLINTMRLVGARNSFICKPFIRDNVFSGIVASIVAIMFILCVLYFASKRLDDIIDIINLQSVLLISIVVIVAGILITGISSFFSVTKYLRMKTDKLYE